MDWPLIEGPIDVWREWLAMQEEREMMSLQPYLPPTTGEAGSVFALLQVIADPKAAKAVLEKMVEEKRAIDNATAKQQEQFKVEHEKIVQDRAENEKLKRTADVVASKAMSDLNDAKAKLNDADRRMEQIAKIEKQTAEQRAEIEERAAQLDEAEKTNMQNYRALQKEEADMARRETMVAKREADLELREKTLADDIAEHNKWLAGLKPPRAR